MPTDQPHPDPWHHLAAEEVVARHKTNVSRGLSATEAAEQRRRHGPNVLTARRGHGSLVRFLLQFHQPLIYILLVAAGVTAVLEDWIDAGVILGVVLVNAVVGFLQEGKALKAIEALAHRRPVVGTTIGLEGLGLVHGEHASFADDPWAFAEAIVAVATDAALREHLAASGHQHWQQRFTIDAIVPILAPGSVATG